MTEHSARFARFSGTFTDRVEGVPDGAWDNPAPCEGWVARDVVRHLVEWVPGLIHDSWDLPRPDGPSVDDDPAGAWSALRDSIQAILDDPDLTTREADIRPGRFALGPAIDMFVTGDVFLHTWDLSRATGQDETLDPDEVHARSRACCRWTRCSARAGTTGRRSRSPTTPTSRPGCSPSSAATSR